MKLTSLLGNSQRLDGGAMFGNAPKALWTRWITPDDRNRIPLACRALLCVHEGRNILFETGIGAFFEPRLRDRYGVVEPHHVLLESLNEVGLSHSDIDIVVLSHLHFDHAGGMLTTWSDQSAPELLFDKAEVLVGKEAWERACSPHPRDRASFIPALHGLLEASGRLHLADGDTHPLLGDDFRFHRSSGHTPGLLVTELSTPAGPVVFGSDLIPGMPWVHLPITMGYDRFPEQLIDEKRALLTDLHSRDGFLFFVHDADTALARVALDERGRFHGTGPQAALQNWPANT